MSAESLEMLGTIDRSSVARYVQRSAQRDELLVALKNIAAIENKMDGTDWEEIEEARAIARAAIAKAEGCT